MRVGTMQKTRFVMTAALTLVLGALVVVPQVSAQAGTCNGLPITVDLNAGQLPTPGDDVIMGTPGDDVIAAGAGIDTVCGGDGDDKIWGQDGNDALFGGPGDDRLRGGDGDDALHGGDGVDNLAGGRDDDIVSGGLGDDALLRGGTGDDLLNGDDGDDVLVAGNGGSDRVNGNGGNDKVTGGPRPDELNGGDGNDLLLGHKGADVLDGGAGDDNLIGGDQPDELRGGPGDADVCHGGTTGDGALENDLASGCETETAIEGALAALTFMPGEILMGSAQAVAAPSNIAAVTAGDRALGLDIFSAVAGDENTMLSPYSIATALGMLYAGADGTTAAQMADVMHLTVDDDTFHATRGAIDAAVATTTPIADTTALEIRPANSIWGQGDYPFADAWLDVLATNYDAGLHAVDFVGDPDGSRELINNWVLDATEDRINDLLPEGSVTSDTRAVLVNAIWFFANWEVPFRASATTPLPFTRLDNSAVTVPMLRSQAARTGYADLPNYEAIHLDYAGDARMVIALPKGGMTPAQLAATLDPSATIPFDERLVNLTLPKFDFDATTPLGDALTALGMTEAFNQAAANLDPITGAPNDLFVSDAIHKTFIKVDENGTEAAAATGIVVGVVSAPPPATFTADRPFLFWIEHTPTNEMLFLGQVTNPS